MKKHILILTIAVMSLMGCSKKEGAEPTAQSPTTTGTPTTSVTTTTLGTATIPTTPGGARGTGSSSQTWYWTTGGQAILNYDNVGTFSDYTGRDMNRPSAVKINVDLKAAGGVYSGTVKIGYYDTDVTGQQKYIEGVFNSGTGSEDTKYNHWVNVEGSSQQVFQAFFEDAEGGLIIVFDGKDDNNRLRGSVYYKNFDWSVCSKIRIGAPGACAAKPPTKCWNIGYDRDPNWNVYDCRDFVVNRNVRMGSTMYPTLYTRLGTFEGLDWNKTFNQ